MVSANDRKIIHEYNSIPQPIIRLVYTSLISCACVFLSWLVRHALSRLLSLLQNSIPKQIPSIFEGWMQRLAPQAYAENKLSDIFGAVSAKSGRLTDFDNLGIWASGTIRQGQHLLSVDLNAPSLVGVCRINQTLTTGCP